MRLKNTHTTTNRLLSGAASIAMIATYLIPAFPVVNAAAEEETEKVFPTAFAAPNIITVYDEGWSANSEQEYDSYFCITYTTGADFVDYVRTMDAVYYADANGNPNEDGPYFNSAYGMGYESYAALVQTDFRIDGGDWHYDESWDEDPYMGVCSDAAYFGSMGIFSGSDSRDESHPLYEYADCFNEQTNGTDVWYAFDAENHTIELRARLFVRTICSDWNGEEYVTEELTTLSDWSESAAYGAGVTDNYTVPEVIDAPVMRDAFVENNDELNGAPIISFLAEPTGSAVAEFAALEQYYGWASLEIEASFDGGQTWFYANSDDVYPKNEYRFNLYEAWYASTNGESDTYAFVGGEVLVRSRYLYYLSDTLVNGLEYSDYEAYSDWSEPIGVTVEGTGVYTLSISHEGTGYAGAGTLTKVLAAGTEIGGIDCSFYEGCYVESVSVNGEVVYTYDNPEACTALYWVFDDHFLFTDNVITQDLDVIITYNGTPTETVDVRISYTSDYGSVDPAGEPDPDYSTDGIYVGVDSVYIGSDVTYSFNPHGGCRITRVLIDGVEDPDALAAGYYTFASISENHTVAVEFEKYAACIYWDSTENGTIVAEGYPDDQNYAEIPFGEDVTFTIDPAVDAESGAVYLINEISITIGSNDPFDLSETDPELFAQVVETGTLSFSDLSEDFSIYVTFSTVAHKTVRISTSAGAGGSIAESFDAAVDSNAVVWISPDEGYAIDTVTVDGVIIENFSGQSYVFENVTEDHTISVTFKAVEITQTYTVNIINTTSSELNTVTPTGSQAVYEGASLSISYAVGEGYALTDILVNGTSIGADAIAALDGTYTLQNVTADTNVEFLFSAITCTVTFVDWNGTVLSESVCDYGTGLIESGLDTSDLTEIVDGQIRFFAMWDKEYDVVYEDVIITALYGTFELRTEDIDITTEYHAKTGAVQATFNTVTAFVTMPTRDLDESGARIYTENEYDITADCYANPTTLDVAFEESDEALITLVYEGDLLPFIYTFREVSISYTPITLLGDVNFDGKVNSDDAVQVLKAYAAKMIGGDPVLNDEQMLLADVNSDGLVDTTDAVYILKYASLEMIQGSVDWETILSGER